MPTRLSISTARAQAALRPPPRCSATCSAIWSPTVNTGLSDVIGSWKIIVMSFPRIASISGSGNVRSSRPSNQISPATYSPGGVSIRRMIESEVTLLPQPDSPTRPMVEPRLIEKSTPSTAGTVPSMTWKWVLRPRTSSRTSSGGGVRTGFASLNAVTSGRVRR